ncbi:DUF389 domain-containing protein [Croceimicrobium sp.]|uniref:DUF389 domain-containing protein n=1 Tax=Croceimicrobium sp. TaxID=2828340 RepID=UPI003BAB078F
MTTDSNTEANSPNPSPEPHHPEHNPLAIAFRYVRKFLNQTLRIEGNAHPQETIESIKADIDFQGYNVWILIFSILIASIGLNVNSGAVVIGAMLISPLMGPILGMGLSMGINDWATMKRSLRNFAIMFSVSIITSTIYFSLTPLVDAQSELLARTRPTLLDVFVAFIGGLAGILAANRRIKTNVVPGVAIATALMPPLCTAGYGLATGQWSFFMGAFYLFLINSIFISLATFVIVRFLNFPVKEFVDQVRAKRARRYIVAVILIIVVPSGYTFYNVVTESYFNRRVESFISENVFYDGAELVKKEVVHEEGHETQINLVFFGEPIPGKIIDSWRSKLGAYNLEGSVLKVVQPQSMDQMNSEEVTKLVDVFSKSQLEIQDKDRTIAELKLALEGERRQHLPLQQIHKELQVMYPRLHSVSMARMVEFTEGATDTLMMAELKWNAPDTTGLDAECKTIGRWLEARLQVDTISVQRKLVKLKPMEVELKGLKN